MTSTFARGAVRVTTPASYDAQEPARPGTRGLPGEHDAAEGVGQHALLAALADSDLSLVQRVDLAPTAARGLGEPAAGLEAGTVQVEVDVPAGEDAVVLLERDGVYSWHLPVNPLERTRGLEPEPRTARFEIEVQRSAEHPVPPAPDGPRTRSLLGALVHGPARAMVFRFVAPLVLGKAIATMEQHVHPGLVHLTDADLGAWRGFETLDELHLPTDRPLRLLLLVHGTFDSTAGAFGAWAVDENGQGFLRTAIGAYDAVIGFDHRTLSVDPRQNAEDLLARLSTHHPEAELVIDVICHSRGGLTTRSFVEQVLPGSGWPGTVDIVVFVAATNAGTRLADPQRWHDLVDLYTNLASVAAGGLALLPSGAPVAAVVGGVVRGIGAFVKYLASYAAEGDDVPGLKAMVPGGAFVTELNRTQEGQPGPGTDWFVVSSDFHVSLLDDSHHPPEFPRELARRLAEGVVDRLFEGPNDLVVETASMDAIDASVGGFVRDRLDLGQNDLVYHTNYFGQLAVITAIAGWLPLGMGAGGDEQAAEAEMVEPEMAEPPQLEELPGGESRARRAAPPSPPPSPYRAEPPPTRGLPPTAAAPSTGAEPPEEVEEVETTRATLAAEMPERVVSQQEFLIRVRLSRNAIQAGAGTVHAEEIVQVDASRPLSAGVVGKSNAAVVGPAHDLFELPVGGGISELQFRAKSLSTGPVEVRIVVRQGRVIIATLTLTATAVAEDEVAAMPPATPVVASIHTGVDAPELEDNPCLDIVERQLPDGSVVFHYAVRLVPGEPASVFESRPIKDRQHRIGTILDDVAEIWTNGEGDPGERERKLQDIGAKLFDELFPEPMQAYLWKHRTKVKDLIVYADEPFVPWELVHLKPPDGPRPTSPRFLAQSGLVRWHIGSFPRREIPVRAGRARSLCPAYLDPRFALTEPVFERQFLEHRFGATPVTATPAGVRELLRSGRFDLLHFSGHGAADPDDILDAKLLLQGRKRDGTVDPEYLGATTVSENARLSATEGCGPVVVLNACQVGRAGELLTTVGGFAKAFLDAGASAFVSCLWSVGQEPSRTFVEKLYTELLAGTPMSTASARAREKTRKAGDATWLAFVVYARPDAVLVRS